MEPDLEKDNYLTQPRFDIFIGAVDRQFNSDPPADRHLVFVSPAFLVVFLF